MKIISHAKFSVHSKNLNVLQNLLSVNWLRKFEDIAKIQYLAASGTTYKQSTCSKSILEEVLQVKFNKRGSIMKV